jgi:hypothetical protein
MKDNPKKDIFICSLSESALNVLKCSPRLPRPVFLAFESEEIAVGADEKNIADKLSLLFKKLDYKNNPVILSLNLNQATCRYLKVPALNEQEIENIASLQASRYLPYPAGELISGYQVLFTDKSNYSHINLIIVHKNVINRYLKAFAAAGIRRPDIFLSSYGLTNLYNFLKGQEQNSSLAVELDYSQAQLAIISRKKLLFSRYFKFNRSSLNWQNSFIEEISKTRDAFSKEMSAELPQKIVFISPDALPDLFTQEISSRLNIPVETISFAKAFAFSDNTLSKLISSPSSSTSLVGFGLQEINYSLNLLPSDIREEKKSAARQTERIKITLLICGIILLWVSAIYRNLDNKTTYLKRLKSELNKISAEAKPLEEIEKRIKFSENRSKKTISALDLLSELHKLIPAGISLVNFGYEEENQVVLRGQGSQLNEVFSLVSQLEGSGVFSVFNIKVRYATQKKTQSAEVIDFEIVCARNK